jgi:hypothetical protein
MPRRCGTPGLKLCTSTSAVRTQGQQGAQVVGLLQVQHHAQLAAVHADEGAALGLQRGRVGPQVVAAGRFDLDDLGTLVGQQRTGVGPAM